MLFVAAEQIHSDYLTGYDDLLACGEELVAAVLAGLNVDPISMF